MLIDWAEITSKAYLTLLELNFCDFPMPVTKAKIDGVKISSYQKYAAKTNLSIEEITLGHELDDAFLLKELRPGLSLILYNEEKYCTRLRHSLWHEVGHVKCNHQKHGSREEIEAHFFAAQANAPNILIKEIAKRGYMVNVPFLMDCFGMSEESAKKKSYYLNNYHFNHTNEYDDVILMQFSGYINAKYPPRTKFFYDDHFQELEKERGSWSN